MEQYDVIYKLTEVGNQILETSKSRLYMSMRFLAMAFDGLEYALNGKHGNGRILSLLFACLSYDNV